MTHEVMVCRTQAALRLLRRDALIREVQKLERTVRDLQNEKLAAFLDTLVSEANAYAVEAGDVLGVEDLQVIVERVMKNPTAPPAPPTFLAFVATVLHYYEGEKDGDNPVLPKAWKLSDAAAALVTDEAVSVARDATTGRHDNDEANVREPGSTA